LTDIPLVSAVVEGGDKGVPIIMADPSSPATKAYTTLAGQVASQLSIIHADKEKPASSFEIAWEG
jgi:ATP-binding protein involved in chromosome partitioning